MRSLPVRRILPPAHSLSAASLPHPTVSIQIRARPNQPITSQDNLWQSCFSRAYSRTVLSKDQPRRSIKSCSRQQSSVTNICSSNVSGFFVRKQRQRFYTSAAVAVPNVLHDVNEPLIIARHTSSHGTKLGENTSTKKKSISTVELMAQLNQSLKDHDHKSAMDINRLIRRRTLPTDQIRPWLHSQQQLVQLLHFKHMEISASSRAKRMSKYLSQLDWSRTCVLSDISERILQGNGHADNLTSLVDAIGKSRAMIQHMYATNSSIHQQDWRDALKVLETWSDDKKPWEWKTNTDGDATTESKTSATTPIWKNTVLERELGGWLVKIMTKLVHSHTYLVRTMLDTIPKQFGIKTTVDMYLVLLNYYAMLGRHGYRDTLLLIECMDKSDVSWKHQPAVYDYLLYSLSHMSGNEAYADKIINQMLANDLVPREDTMKAAILCAARSGDMETCSRYIARMHNEWNLSITERMKAILLYACAQRGDFNSAIDILVQLGDAGTLVHPKAASKAKKGAIDKSALLMSMQSNPQLEEILSTQNIINNSNVLLALINQTNNKRGSKKHMTIDFIKEEVAKVLELFTVVAKDPRRIDTQLYTIMMQYLSTLPSPIPGMAYLYKEMRETNNAQPNHVTYRIMLEACADQMDMEYGKQLWDDMEEAKITKDCYVRASYVKGWGKIGYLKQAEWIAREGLLMQEGLDRDLRRYRAMMALKGRKQREQGISGPLHPSRPPKRQRSNNLINLSVVHELMRANRAHNKPERVYEIYREIESGKWGHQLQPNQYTLSIVLQACGSSTATSTLVDQGVDLVERYLDHQRQQLQQFKDEENDQEEGSVQDRADNAAEDAVATILGKSSLTLLSDINYQLYFNMLARHHRQHKMVAVWEEMMKAIERPPPQGTINLVVEALENVQWGATPIKRIQRELRERWKTVDWDKRIGRAMGQHTGGEYDDDRLEGPGGRFWR